MKLEDETRRKQKIIQNKTKRYKTKQNKENKKNGKKMKTKKRMKAWISGY